MESETKQEIFERRLQRCILELIVKHKLNDYQVVKRSFPSDGNFFGVLYAVDIKEITPEGKNELNVFVKYVDTSVKLDFYSVSQVHNREIFVYKELFKIYEDLQDEAKIPKENRLKTVQMFESNDKEFLLLENLSRKDYRTIPRMDFISLEFAELSIEQLAKFHALSFMLEKKRPEYFLSNIKSLKHSIKFDDNFQTFLKQVTSTTMTYVGARFKDRVEAFLPILMKKHPKYLGDHTASKICTLCHGDFKVSNILIQECNGAITDAVPIDYQQIYYGCPIQDLIYLIFYGTDRHFRQKYLIHLKYLYYRSLEDFLKLFGEEIGQVFPKEDFDSLFKERLDYGLIISLIQLHFIFAVDGDTMDISQCEEHSAGAIAFGIDDKYRERLTGILEDFTDWGYL